MLESYSGTPLSTAHAKEIVIFTDSRAHIDLSHKLAFPHSTDLSSVFKTSQLISTNRLCSLKHIWQAVTNPVFFTQVSRIQYHPTFCGVWFARLNAKYMRWQLFFVVVVVLTMVIMSRSHTCWLSALSGFKSVWDVNDLRLVWERNGLRYIYLAEAEITCDFHLAEAGLGSC